MATSTSSPMRLLEIPKQHRVGPAQTVLAHRSFLKRKGFAIGDEIMMQRLVHLTDETKRNELMIIYLEDLSALGMTAAELAPGGAKAANWPDISNALLDRAIKGMRVSN